MYMFSHFRWKNHSSVLKQQQKEVIIMLLYFSPILSHTQHFTRELKENFSFYFESQKGNRKNEMMFNAFDAESPPCTIFFVHFCFLITCKSKVWTLSEQQSDIFSNKRQNASQIFPDHFHCSCELICLIFIFKHKSDFKSVVK